MNFNSVEEAIKIHKDEHGYNKGRIIQFTPGNQFFDLHRMRINWLVDNIKEGDKVLDVGCSGGEFIKYIKSKVDCECTGIDVNDSAINHAKEEGIDAFVCSVENLTLKDNSFDIVLMSEVLEHLYDPIVALKEIKRVLKPNGRLIGSVPHKDSYILKDKPASVYKYHARDYGADTLRSDLEKVFDNVIINTVLVNLIEIGQSPFWLVFKGGNNA